VKRWILPVIAVLVAGAIAWPFLFGSGTAEIKGKTYSVQHLLGDGGTRPRGSPLRGLTHLESDRAILCSWDRDRYLYFWSEGSGGRFDVLFLDASGKVLQVEKMYADPSKDYLDDRGVASDVEARRALFLNGGASNGVSVGDTVTLSSDLLKAAPEPMAQIKVGPHSLFVEVSDTLSSRNRGLMHRPKMSKGEGMLFIYPSARPGVNFYMRNTLMSLDIAFYEASGRFLNVNSAAHAKNPYTDGASINAPARGVAQVVLEVPIGWYRENQLADEHGMPMNNAHLELPDALRKRAEKAQDK
jgi:uncharacterized membrane protein (UPF0127 family)